MDFSLLIADDLRRTRLCSVAVVILVAEWVSACGGGASEAAATPASTSSNTTTNAGATNTSATTNTTPNTTPNNAPTSDPTSIPSGVSLSDEEWQLVSLINRYRQTNGRSALGVSVAISQAAHWMSDDMSSKNYFSHTDSLIRDPFVRMAALGYAYATTKGENIAAGNTAGLATFNQWRCSPGHNAIMLEPNFRVFGLARVANSASTYRFYWTADFGGQVDTTIAITEPSALAPLPTAACP